MKSMLHLSQVNKLVSDGAEFSFAFVSKSGAIIGAERCVCTSFHASGRTMNVKWLDSGEFRKVRRTSIIAFNDREVVL